jgi:histidinol-phosphate aminotransferase
MSLLARARPELAAFKPYASARRSGFQARIRLDANESPWDVSDDGSGQIADLNRYPSPQPDDMRAGLATLYGVDADQLWLGRGSDEAIDLLVRAFCRPGRDNIVTFTPTFGMYRIGAQLQGADFRTLGLDADTGFDLDIERLLALTDDDTKIVIICSPNNPSGTLYHEHVAPLAERLAGRALLLVDEAYIEFAGVDSAAALIGRHANLAVLRTLSKAHALAGARVGALIARPEIVDLVARIAAPYPLPTPSVLAALLALEERAITRMYTRVSRIVGERERVSAALSMLSDVRTVWPSAGNFVLVRFDDAAIAFNRLLGADILVRDFSAQPGLDHCLRITIGRPEDNDALLDALAGGGR